MSVVNIPFDTMSRLSPYWSIDAIFPIGDGDAGVDLLVFIGLLAVKKISWLWLPTLNTSPPNSNLTGETSNALVDRSAEVVRSINHTLGREAEPEMPEDLVIAAITQLLSNSDLEVRNR